MPAASAACGAGSSRSGRGSRWPRARRARPCVVEHQVDAGEAAAAEQPQHVERELLRALRSAASPSSAGQTNVVRPICSAPRSRRSPRRAGRPRRSAAPRRRGSTRRARGRATWRSSRTLSRVGERGDQRRRARRRREPREPDAQRDALVGGLDDDREARAAPRSRRAPRPRRAP